MRITTKSLAGTEVKTRSIKIGGPLTGISVLSVEIRPEDLTHGRRLTEYLEQVIYPRMVTGGSAGNKAPEADDEPLVQFDAIIPDIERALTTRGRAPRVLFEGFTGQLDRFSRMSGIRDEVLEITIRLSRQSRVNLLNPGNDDGNTETDNQGQGTGQGKAESGRQARRGKGAGQAKCTWP